VVDSVWFAVMIALGAPRLAVLCALVNVGVNVLSIVFPAHWLVYGYQEAIYISTQAALVASLTVLPYKYPERFGIQRPKSGNKGSYFALSFKQRNRPAFSKL
jgi:hypothetical protein